MIPAKMLKLKGMKRVTRTEPDPDTGQLVPVDFGPVEQHLFMEPGGVCQHTDGVWNLQPPDKTSPVYRLVSKARKVIEHEDGTITVEGPPFATKNNHGGWRLIKGMWIQAGDEVQAPAPPATEA